ncbi:hypothetical protein J6590_063151 [Homalodisca vitripennis]|nr:hypothetical protein J6590_063149 [Homalodisca vitripennis]KAG8330477.1 hypothetical protein J6590_063151 [Homalodisca vitripennis]
MDGRTKITSIYRITEHHIYEGESGGPGRVINRRLPGNELRAAHDQPTHCY